MMKQIHNIHGEIAVQYTITTKSIHMPHWKSSPHCDHNCSFCTRPSHQRIFNK